jgi:hypothetical protein
LSLTIPNNWTARPHQRDLFNSFGHGKRFQRGCAVWHRRAGKDSCALNLTARDMFKRVGTYWHLFPEQTQARRAIWNGIDREGRRIIDQFLPPEVRKRENGQEMLIETVNGSIWQMAGSDNYDSLVGSNPVGVVFSEWSLAHPEAWDYIRPIIVENGGWALFIYTPRGRNHGYHTFEHAQQSDDWFCQRLTIDDTGIVSPDQIAQERAAGMSDSKIAQEFYCSFEAAEDDAVIPVDIIDHAMKNEIEVSDTSPIVWGLDVARHGDDSSVLAKRQGPVVHPLKVWNKLDLMQLSGAIKLEWEQTLPRHQPVEIIVDSIGIGAGVVDRLRELGLPVRGLNVSERPSIAETYLNLRSELWFKTKDWLSGRDVQLPKDDGLFLELSGPRYTYTSNGKIQVESKESMKKRGVKSPDRADAVCLTLAVDFASLAFGKRSDWGKPLKRNIRGVV